MGWKKKNRGKSFKVASKRNLLYLTIILFFIAAFFVVRSNILIIKTIEIQTEKIGCTDKDKVEESVNLSGRYLYSVDEKKLAAELKNKYLCVKTVTLSKILPDKVKISVLGREPAVAAISLKDKEATQSSIAEDLKEASSSAQFSFNPSGFKEKFLVDNEGIVYSATIEQTSVPLVFISGFNLILGQKLEGQLINNTLKILEKVKSFGIEVKEVKIYPQEILLIMGEPRLIFRVDERVDEQIASLQLILQTAKINRGTISPSERNRGTISPSERNRGTISQGEEDSQAAELIDLRFDKPIVKFAPNKK